MIYFIRKIDTFLDKWFKHESKNPALLVGIRQCGKTESIRELNSSRCISESYLNSLEMKVFSIYI